MDSLKMNLIPAQVLNIQGTPRPLSATRWWRAPFRMTTEGLVKEQLANARGK